MPTILSLVRFTTPPLQGAVPATPRTSKTGVQISCLFSLWLLAPGLALGQTDLRKGHLAEVKTVRTDRPMVAGRAIGGLAIDAKGRFYVANFSRKVFRIDPDGTVMTLTDRFQQASGNTIDRRGELLQSDYQRNRLFRVHEDGSRTLVTSQGLVGPVGVAVNDDEEIFVANFLGDTISKVAPDGTTNPFSADPLLNGPNGIFIDGEEMYVVNFRDNLVLRIEKTGQASVLAAVGGLGSTNNAHVTVCGGKLYVSKIFSHRIYEVTKSGQVRVVAGTGAPGTRNGFAPSRARLYHPNGMATGPEGKVIYTNNYIGLMGTPGSNMIVRAIYLPPVQDAVVGEFQTVK